MLEVVDAHGTGRGQARLDPVPGRMGEVERERQLRIEGAEEQLEHALVARVDQLHAHRPEAVAEHAHPFGELADHPGSISGQLRCKPEPGRGLLRPAAELVFGRQPVARRVELDRAKPLRVVPKEVSRVGACGVEIRLPRRIGPAGGSDGEVRQRRPTPGAAC